MPLSLAALTAETAHATLRIGDETLEVDWYPKRYTTEMMRRFAELETLDVDRATMDEIVTALDTAADMLAQLVARWDFYEYISDDGAPGPVIAITQERLRRCSFEALWSILTELLKETRLGETNGMTSRAPSRASSSTKATRTGSRR